MPCEAPVMIATSSARKPAPSRDQVGVVDHASLPACAYADEDTLVQPVEVARRSLDLRGRAERVVTRVDLVAACKPREDLRAAVAHAPRLHVEQSAVVGLECVANVADG